MCRDAFAYFIVCGQGVLTCDAGDKVDSALLTTILQAVQKILSSIKLTNAKANVTDFVFGLLNPKCPCPLQ